MRALPAAFASPRVRIALAVAALAALAWAGGLAARAAVVARLRAATAERGWSASWRALDVAFPLRVRVRGLAVDDARSGAAIVRAESLEVSVSPWSLLALSPAPSSVRLARARVAVPRAAAAAPDTLDPGPEPARGRRDERPVAPRVQRAAEAAARAVLLPARRLPRLALSDVTVSLAGRAGDADDPADTAGATVTLERLDLHPVPGGVSLEARGALGLERPVPFAFDLAYGHDDRLAGHARFMIPDPAADTLAPLALAVDGRVTQDRRRGELRVADSTRIAIGEVELRAGGRVARAGPAVSLALAADGVTPDAFARSVPRPMLGPLAGVVARGAWDWRFALDLDLGDPGAARVEARVVPRGLTLDLARTRLEFPPPEGPFTATVRLPRGRVVTRELSPANPHFRPLEAMDSLLVHAVVTNEDGGFFRHGGFNLEAVEGAIADNLRAGRFVRGAGTITMQLARNLYLGHERTLSRKMQEVLLAWILEHLTWLEKRRLLEIYLNVIEWGPGVHGADEAAAYYFGKDAGRLTLDESLFLTTVIPAPSRWRGRLDAGGSLRPWARAQMHFIGRAMVAKGWLRAEELPPADSLRIEVRGPARDVLFPPAARDSAAARAEAAGPS
uniref:Glycosyl transferase family 51 domain-containing protein n=1 Tax=Eiseniibacteriota bacterium TaxID=2212470 RepID=A0A832MKS1_UNCEI